MAIDLETGKLCPVDDDNDRYASGVSESLMEKFFNSADGNYVFAVEEVAKDPREGMSSAISSLAGLPLMRFSQEGHSEKAQEVMDFLDIYTPKIGQLSLNYALAEAQLAGYDVRLEDKGTTKQVILEPAL
ncbi:MAG: hypothetical protein CL565_04660 [Alphaproteobacteria bacterium]|nr:hypothetical protein [Alphaproteobacteria bacterium]|tara:strand:- start:462 stop:851 length:390 start_codon:yes stop_codon:yes gene_type:complete